MFNRVELDEGRYFDTRALRDAYRTVDIEQSTGVEYSPEALDALFAYFCDWSPARRSDINIPASEYISGLTDEERRSLFDECCEVLAQKLTEAFELDATPSEIASLAHAFANDRLDSCYEFILGYLWSVASHLHELDPGESTETDGVQTILNKTQQLPEGYRIAKIEQYANAREAGKPVNETRHRLLEAFETAGGVGPDTLENIKEEIRERRGDSVFQNWRNYTIVGQVYYDFFKPRLQQYLEDIGDALRAHIETDLAIHTVDFQGSQNYLGDKSWLALHNKEKSHNQSFQLFLSIRPDHLACGLYPGDAVEENLPESYGGVRERRDETGSVFEWVLETLQEDEQLFRRLEFGESGPETYGEYQEELTVPSMTVEPGGLYFPDDMWTDIESRIERALDSGKHVMLVGPPGTGKTRLAKQICEGSAAAHELVTASADWTTFDTIGGYQTGPDDRLEFQPGVFLERFQNGEGEPTNEWLIIDEINRADIDKAFGALFTALTGESVVLSFEDSDDRSIELLDADRTDEGVQSNRYYIHDDWRMIATMNTLDKTSLYEMSYAFMRRWAFVPVGVPDVVEHDGSDDSTIATTVEAYVEKWDGPSMDEAEYERLGELWRTINREQTIGPAILEDIYRYVAADAEDRDYVSPVVMYVFPQLEGLRRDQLESLLGNLEELESFDDGDTETLWRQAQEFFQVELERGA